MKLFQLGLMHGGIWPEEDDDDDCSNAFKSGDLLGGEKPLSQPIPLPKQIRDLVERRRRDRDSSVIGHHTK
jgi:hypothetical protein